MCAYDMDRWVQGRGVCTLTRGAWICSRSSWSLCSSRNRSPFLFCAYSWRSLWSSRKTTTVTSERPWWIDTHACASSAQLQLELQPSVLCNNDRFILNSMVTSLASTDRSTLTNYTRWIRHLNLTWCLFVLIKRVRTRENIHPILVRWRHTFYHTRNSFDHE